MQTKESICRNLPLATVTGLILIFGHEGESYLYQAILFSAAVLATLILAVALDALQRWFKRAK